MHKDTKYKLSQVVYACRIATSPAPPGPFPGCSPPGEERQLSSMPGRFRLRDRILVVDLAEPSSAAGPNRPAKAAQHSGICGMRHEAVRGCPALGHGPASTLQAA